MQDEKISNGYNPSINHPVEQPNKYLKSGLLHYTEQKESITSSNVSNNKSSLMNSSIKSSIDSQSLIKKNSDGGGSDRQKAKSILIKKYNQMNKPENWLNPNSSRNRVRRASIFAPTPEKKETISWLIPQKQKLCKRFKTLMTSVFDSPIYIIIMSLFTLFAILGSDIQNTWLSPSCDASIDVVQLFIFVSFSLEIIITCIIDHEYFLSLLFWWDVVSVMSLLLEIGFFEQLIFNFDGFTGNTQHKTQVALNKISIASGTTRVWRILRIVKWIRIIKIYKTVSVAKMRLEKNEEKKKDDLKKKLKILEKKKTELQNSSQINLINGDNSKLSSPQKGNKISFGSREVKWNNSRRFSVNVLNAGSNTKQKQQKMWNPQITKIKEVSDEWLQESNINKILSDKISNLVFFIVLLVLLIYPFLWDDFYQDENTNMSYQFLVPLIENYYLWTNKIKEKNLNSFIKHSIDESFPLISIYYDDNWLYLDQTLSEKKYRDNEIYTLLSSNHKLKIVYSTHKSAVMTALFNFIRSWFVCLIVAISIWTIEGSTKEKVWEPLEVMMEILDNLVQDPANAKNVKNWQSGMKTNFHLLGKEETNNPHRNNTEIQILKTSIIKISALLSIGFGKLGSKIITKALATSRKSRGMNSEDYLKNILYRDGKKMAGVYFNFKIKKFSWLNSKLKKQSIILLSHLSEIIYNSIELFGGEIQNNYNGIVSAIWKFNPKFMLGDNKLNSSNNVNIESNTSWTWFKPYEQDINCWMENMTELAWFSCLHMINKLRKQTYSIISDWNNKVLRYNITLHLGSCIEGFAGGNSKIDWIHWQENNKALIQWQEACDYYGVEILFSENVYAHWSGVWQPWCRHIDTVYFGRNSSMKFQWFTLDLNLKKKKGKYRESIGWFLSNEEKEVIQWEKKEKLIKGICNAGSICEYILKRNSFHNLWNSDYPKEFVDSWCLGLNEYWNGNWSKAIEKLLWCQDWCETDTPTLRLIEYIEINLRVPPRNWRGARNFYEILEC